MPLLRFKLNCINVLLAASAAEPSAPAASDRFPSHHFPENIPPTQSTRIHRRDVFCAPATRKEKKADTNVGNVHAKQDFAQHLASKFTTLNDTEH